MQVNLKQHVYVDERNKWLNVAIGPGNSGFSRFLLFSAKISPLVGRNANAFCFCNGQRILRGHAYLFNQSPRCVSNNASRQNSSFVKYTQFIDCRANFIIRKISKDLLDSIHILASGKWESSLI